MLYISKNIQKSTSVMIIKDESNTDVSLNSFFKCFKFFFYIVVSARLDCFPPTINSSDNTQRGVVLELQETRWSRLLHD